MESTLHCAQCGYDLRVIGAAGVCPECGTAITDSIAAVTDPLMPVRRKIHWAANLLLLSAASKLASAIFIFVVFLKESLEDYFTAIPYIMIQFLKAWPIADTVASIRVLLSPDSRSMSPNERTMTVWSVASFLVELLGALLLTQFQPRWMARHVRWFANWAIVASVAGYSIVFSLRLWSFPNSMADASFLQALLALVTIVAIVAWASQLLTHAGVRRAPFAACTAAISTIAATVINAPMRFTIVGTLGGAACTLVSFVTLTWLWLKLRRATFPHRSPHDGRMT